MEISLAQNEGGQCDLHSRTVRMVTNKKGWSPLVNNPQADGRKNLSTLLYRFCSVWEQLKIQFPRVKKKIKNWKFIWKSYSPKDVMRFLNYTSASEDYPSEALEIKSRQALVDLVRDDFNGSADFICNEPDTGSDTKLIPGITVKI